MASMRRTKSARNDQAYLEQLTQRLRKAGLKVRQILRFGNPAQELSRTIAEEHIDLLVLGGVTVTAWWATGCSAKPPPRCVTPSTFPCWRSASQPPPQPGLEVGRRNGDPAISDQVDSRHAVCGPTASPATHLAFSGRLKPKGNRGTTLIAPRDYNNWEARPATLRPRHFRLKENAP